MSSDGRLVTLFNYRNIQFSSVQFEVLALRSDVRLFNYKNTQFSSVQFKMLARRYGARL